MCQWALGTEGEKMSGEWQKEGKVGAELKVPRRRESGSQLFPAPMESWPLISSHLQLSFLGIGWKNHLLLDNSATNLEETL